MVPPALPRAALGLLFLLGACGGPDRPRTPVAEVVVPVAAAAPPDACEAAARRVLASLDRPVTLTAYVTTGEPTLDAFVGALRAVLEREARLSGGKLAVTVVEAENAEQYAEAKKAGMQDGWLGPHESKPRGYLGVALREGAETDAIPSLDPADPRGVEYMILHRIRDLHARATHQATKIGVLTGKEEIRLTDPNLVPEREHRGPSMASIFEQAVPFYHLENVDLQGGEADIPNDLEGLVITQPGVALTERERRRIDQFLMRGNKAVAVFGSAVNLAAGDGGMNAVLDTRGLDALLDPYGVELKKDAVLDWGHPAMVQLLTQGQPLATGHPGNVLVQHARDAGAAAQPLDAGFPAFFHLEELVFPFPSTLVPHPERQPGATIRVLARTTPRATAATSATVAMRLTATPLKPRGEPGQRALAVVVEGQIKSAFAARPDRAIPTAAASPGRSRLLVIASSQFLANPYARAGNAWPQPPGDEDLNLIAGPYAQKYLTSTILAFKETLDWMTNDADLDACAALTPEP